MFEKRVTCRDFPLRVAENFGKKKRGFNEEKGTAVDTLIILQWSKIFTKTID